MSRAVTEEMVDAGARAAFIEPASSYRREDMRAALEAVLSADPLYAGLEAEVRMRREKAAELRDLAARCGTVGAVDKLNSKATRQDEDTDRLQRILDAASS